MDAKNPIYGRLDAELGGTPVVGKISLCVQQEINTGAVL